MSALESFWHWVMIVGALALVVCGGIDIARSAPLEPRQALSIYAMAYAQARLPRPEHPPTVHITTQDTLRKMSNCERCPVHALQIGADIYVDEKLDFSNPTDASVLLHEYVHYFQWAAHGAAADCEEWLERERQAYTVQIHALDKVGEPTWSLMVAMQMLGCK